jgi:hypothetical protein
MKDKIEAVALVEELIESVKDAVYQHCSCRIEKEDDDIYDSGAITTNAGAMRLLARLGLFEITSEHGRRVVGKFTEKKIRPDIEEVHTEMRELCEKRMADGAAIHGDWRKKKVDGAVNALPETADTVNYLGMEAESTGNDLDDLRNKAFELGEDIIRYLKERDTCLKK